MDGTEDGACIDSRRLFCVFRFSGPLAFAKGHVRIANRSSKPRSITPVGSLQMTREEVANTLLAVVVHNNRCILQDSAYEEVISFSYFSLFLGFG